MDGPALWYTVQIGHSAISYNNGVVNEITSLLCLSGLNGSNVSIFQYKTRRASLSNYSFEINKCIHGIWLKHIISSTQCSYVSKIVEKGKHRDQPR